jgi:mono/diheme cytochrome c family protein
MRWWLLGLVVLCGLAAAVPAAEKQATTPSAKRGKEALLGRTFAPPMVTLKGYDRLWKTWGLKEKPKDYDRAIRERYGLHVAPYDNKGVPMGLRPASHLLIGKGYAPDCMLCHSGRVAGQTVFGLGNSTIDLQSLFEDIGTAEGFKNILPYQASHVRGTFEAVASVTHLSQFRDDDLNIRPKPLKLALHDTCCEDIPAWWHLKKKKTMYANGGISAQSVRSLMTFLLNPVNSGEYVRGQESTFADIRAYLLTLQPPKYPFPIDRKLAARGKAVFNDTCSRCHGTYGEKWTYPSRVVPLQQIGTDPTLAKALWDKDSIERYKRSWLGQEKDRDGNLLEGTDVVGYQAPPLDGVWATAPYLHNGSVPTVYHVLNSKARPKVYTRSYGTEKEDYDSEKLGWKIKVLEKSPDAKRSGYEKRKVYDTTRPGRGNAGHPFGDKLTESQRKAVIEYLKTL